MRRTTGMVALGVLALAVALGVFWHFRGGSAHWRGPVKQREIAARVLAEHISSRHPLSQALIVGNPFTQRRGQEAQIHAFERAGVRGFEKGFENRRSIKVVYPEVRPEFDQNPGSVYVDPKTTTPLSFLITIGAFDQLARENPEWDLVVSLIGLPLELRSSEVWRSEKHRLALLLPDWRMAGDPGAIKQAFKSGKIAAAVVNRPGAPPETAALEADYKREFSRRFILVTEENIDQLLLLHPRLF